METSDFVAIIGVAMTAMWAGYQTMKAHKLQSDSDSRKTIFTRIDELKTADAAIMNVLRTEYLTADQTNETVRLTIEPLVVRLDHLDQSLNRLTKAIESLEKSRSR